jgi:hypothetical protein
VNALGNVGLLANSWQIEKDPNGPPAAFFSRLWLGVVLIFLVLPDGVFPGFCREFSLLYDQC